MSLNRLIQYFYPDLAKEERRKFILLGSMLFLIMGSYWLGRLLKNVIIWTIALSPDLGWPKSSAESWQPILKMLAPVVTLLFVMIYSSCLDRFKRYKLFRTLCAIYAIIFSAIALFLLLAQTPLTAPYFYKPIPMFIMGTSSFLLIESFGALVPVMFWAWVNTFTQETNAKKGYPLILMMAGLGATIGSSFLLTAPYLGTKQIWPLVTIPALGLFGTIIVLNHYIKAMQITEAAPPKMTTSGKGLLDSFVSGGRLILKHPYLIGTLFFSILGQVVFPIFDYQINVVGKVLWPDPIGFAVMQGRCGLGLNGVSFLLSLLGVSAILRRFKKITVMLIYPVVMFGMLTLLLALCFVNLSHISQFLVLYGIIVALKGLSYAVNNPVKELLWLPTSTQIKLKSKGWIDSFGVRTAKFGGAFINKFFSSAHSYGLGLVIVTLWGL
ncbi:MAG: translocase, partial [Bacillota bacterium]